MDQNSLSRPLNNIIKRLNLTDFTAQMLERAFLYKYAANRVSMLKGIYQAANLARARKQIFIQKSYRAHVRQCFHNFCNSYHDFYSLSKSQVKLIMAITSEKYKQVVEICQELIDVESK